LFDLTPADWTAIELTIRISVVATLCALPFGLGFG
jgi:ABC-type molybdate transport system permease subunit